MINSQYHFFTSNKIIFYDDDALMMRMIKLSIVVCYDNCSDHHVCWGEVDIRIITVIILIFHNQVGEFAFRG